MSTLDPAISPALPAEAAPAAVYESLASRVRPLGLFLLALRPDGTVAFADAQAGTFFQRYALPMLQYPDPATTGGTQPAGTAGTEPGVVIWHTVPGLLVAAFPHVEKRRLVGIVALAAKDPTFALTDDVQRVCSRLGLDAEWLCQQAIDIPTYAEDALRLQAGTVIGMVRDQLRLTAVESELVSLSGQLSTTYEELSLIYQISGGMRVNRQTNDFFKQACLDVMQVIGVRGMGVALRADAGCHLDPVMYGPLGLPPGTVRQLADQLIPRLSERAEAVLINDLANDPRFNWLGAHAKCLLAVPLQRQEKVLGCLFSLDKEAGYFDSADSKLLTSIANESAIYLENAKLYEDVHGLMMGLLHSLTSAVDAKDAYTCGHSERVALISRLVAQEAGISDAEVERIYMAGLLHDVGKIGVPEAVLQKAGRLTPEEFEQMKKHPGIGGVILQNVKQLQDIVPGVLHHHERYDGRGYPYGLSGEAIPTMGRIICLADCFDAMTSNRTYRKALPLEVALTEIRRCSGTQFDPKLTEVFLKLGADRLRELLKDHKQTAKRLLDEQQTLRAA